MDAEAFPRLMGCTDAGPMEDLRAVLRERSNSLYGTKIICRLPRAARYHQGMATYLYETIPQKPGEKPRQFEFVQKMSEPALTHDPKTGKPVRRLIVGGSLITRGTSILSMNRPKRRG